MHPSYLEAGTNCSKYYPNYEHPSDGNLLPDKELTLALENVGIFPDTLVVVYGTDPDGSMAAARLTWALLYAGVKRVRFLDGGIRSWITHNGETSPLVEIAGTSVVPRQSPCAHWEIRSDLLATTAEVSQLNSTQGKLIDVRRRDEWDGSNPNHYSFFSKAGHIPSAEYQGDWKNLVDQRSDKIGPMLDSIAQRRREQGILDAKVEAGITPLIFYCGTGWRSSIAFLVALSLGLRAKNYDDGFYGWSWNQENEIVFGEATPALC
jgi:thiosulfate/3-mercaptopyruvate sulfurtransferase